MALTLTVDRARWHTHLAGVRATFPGVVPVVKGNGYGFGRTYLVDLVGGWTEAAEPAGLAEPAELAVGTVHELAGLSPDGPRPIVLTPALARELVPGVGPAVLTVGSEHHVAELEASGVRPPVIVKVASAMQRYGVAPANVPALRQRVEAAGLTVHGYALHPPLAGPVDDHRRDAERLARQLPAGSALYVSHLDAAGYAAIVSAVPERRWRIRLGTALWHGDKSFLHLAADVLEVRPVRSGERAGYRSVPVPGDGRLVMVTAGTAHGVQALAGGLSPFHFDRRRLALLEPPHMHTSMLFVPEDASSPAVGDQVDVQHPLTRTLVDRIVER